MTCDTDLEQLGSVRLHPLPQKQSTVNTHEKPFRWRHLSFVRCSVLFYPNRHAWVWRRYNAAYKTFISHCEQDMTTLQKWNFEDDAWLPKLCPIYKTKHKKRNMWWATYTELSDMLQWHLLAKACSLIWQSTETPADFRSKLYNVLSHMLTRETKPK